MKTILQALTFVLMILESMPAAFAMPSEVKQAVPAQVRIAKKIDLPNNFALLQKEGDTITFEVNESIEEKASNSAGDTKSLGEVSLTYANSPTINLKTKSGKSFEIAYDFSKNGQISINLATHNKSGAVIVMQHENAINYIPSNTAKNLFKELVADADMLQLFRETMIGFVVYEINPALPPFDDFDNWDWIEFCSQALIDCVWDVPLTSGGDSFEYHGI